MPTTQEMELVGEQTPNIIKLEIIIKWSLLTILIFVFAPSCYVFIIFFCICFAYCKLSSCTALGLRFHCTHSTSFAFILVVLFYVVIHNNPCDQYEYIQHRRFCYQLQIMYAFLFSFFFAYLNLPSG